MLVSLLLVGGALSLLGPADRVPVAYQIKNSNLDRGWDIIPFHHTPVFGRPLTIAFEDLRVFFYEQDHFKIRFSVQNGRLTTPFITIHKDGKIVSDTIHLTMEVSHQNITSIRETHTKLSQEEAFTEDTLREVKIVFDFHEHEHEWLSLLQSIVLSVTFATALLLGLAEYHRVTPGDSTN